MFRSTKLLFVLPLFMIIGCASVPVGKVDFNGPKADVSNTGYMERQIVFDVATPLEGTLQTLLHTPLMEIFDDGGGLPAVVETEVLTTTLGNVGDRKRVQLADGHQAVEQLLAVDTPETFMYQVWGFTTEAKFFATYAVGIFEAEAIDQQNTRVTWTYRFKPNSLVSRLPLWLFLTFNWDSFMSNAAENMSTLAALPNKT